MKSSIICQIKNSAVCSRQAPSSVSVPEESSGGAHLTLPALSQERGKLSTVPRDTVLKTVDALIQPSVLCTVNWAPGNKVSVGALVTSFITVWINETSPKGKDIGACVWLTHCLYTYATHSEMK